MEKFTPIIYDSSFGYDFGFLIEKTENDKYFCDNCNYHIYLVTGMVYGAMFTTNSETLEYNENNFTKILKKYGSSRNSFDYNEMLKKINSEVEIYKQKYNE